MQGCFLACKCGVVHGPGPHGRVWGVLQGHKEWMVEICMLGLVDHAHLVKLLGFCAEGEKRLLVYEFLPYYSLDRYLFALDPSQPVLDWPTRLKIALGSARGLAHLHEEIRPPVRGPPGTHTHKRPRGAPPAAAAAVDGAFGAWGYASRSPPGPRASVHSCLGS